MGNLEVQFIANGALDREYGNHALYTYASEAGMTVGGSGYIGRGIAIDASRSSLIYSNSETVHPLSLVLYRIIKI